MGPAQQVDGPVGVREHLDPGQHHDDPAVRPQPRAPLLVVDYDAKRDVFEVAPRPDALDVGGPASG